VEGGGVERIHFEDEGGFGYLPLLQFFNLLFDELLVLWKRSQQISMEKQLKIALNNFFFELFNLILLCCQFFSKLLCFITNQSTVIKLRL